VGLPRRSLSGSTAAYPCHLISTANIQEEEAEFEEHLHDLSVGDFNSEVYAPRSAVDDISIIEVPVAW
jgi:hypothetical protein